MRFYTKDSGIMKYSRYRDRKFFALWPITIDGETRWLEWVSVYEEYKQGEWRKQWFNKQKI